MVQGRWAASPSSEGVVVIVSMREREREMVVFVISKEITECACLSVCNELCNKGIVFRL